MATPMLEPEQAHEPEPEPARKGLTSLNTGARVSFKDGLPYVEIRAAGTDEIELCGKVSPGVAMSMASWLMAAATAAETEAAMVAELREMGLDDEHTGVMLVRVRQRREAMRPDAEARFEELRADARREGLL
jgi:hypothetical protein